MSYYYRGTYYYIIPGTRIMCILYYCKWFKSGSLVIDIRFGKYFETL